MADPEYAYLTTTGRRTGEPHTVELWYRRTDDGTVWFMAGDAGSDWVRNLRAEPEVRVRVGDGDAATGMASVEEGGDGLRRAFAARYQGWREGAELSGWARSATTVAVRPAPGVRPEGPG